MVTSGKNQFPNESIEGDCNARLNKSTPFPLLSFENFVLGFGMCGEDLRLRFLRGFSDPFRDVILLDVPRLDN